MAANRIGGLSYPCSVRDSTRPELLGSEGPRGSAAGGMTAALEIAVICAPVTVREELMTHIAFSRALDDCEKRWDAAGTSARHSHLTSARSRTVSIPDKWAKQ